MTGPDRTALPARYVDLIRQGVDPVDLRAGGDVAVYRALVGSASSALQHGWMFPEWAALVSEARSRLGQQARTKGVRRDRTRAEYERQLSSAWAAAERFVASAPAPIAREEIAARTAAVRDIIADADADLSDHERAVLARACDVADEHGTDRPALPRKRTAELTGLTEKAVRCTLDRLNRRGLLVLEVRGRRGPEGSTARRAALYRLPTAEALAPAYLYRGTRSVGPSPQVCRPLAPTVLGPSRQVYRPLAPLALGPSSAPNPAAVIEAAPTPAQVCGAPSAPAAPQAAADSTPSTELDSTDPDPEAPPVVTLTITASDPEQLAAALDALRRNPTLDVRPAEKDRPELAAHDAAAFGKVRHLHALAAPEATR